MGWFNAYGLVFMAVIMVPNIIYAVKQKPNLSTFQNKTVAFLEQIGRYGCFFFMIFNLPYTCFGYWFDCASTVYWSVNSVFCLAYLIFWALCWKRNDLLKALALSVLPTCIFLFSGVILINIPLMIFAVLFGFSHIYLSYKNVKQ